MNDYERARDGLVAQLPTQILSRDYVAEFEIAVRADQREQDIPEMAGARLVTGIYRVEPDEIAGVQGSVSLRVLGGPKRYVRIFDGSDRLENGWTLYGSALTLWEVS
jgi:hypothetical protein